MDYTESASENQITSYYSGAIPFPEKNIEIFEFLVSKNIEYYKLYELYLSFFDFKDEVYLKLLPLSTFDNLSISSIDNAEYIEQSWSEIYQKAVSFLENLDILTVDFNYQELFDFRSYFTTHVIKNYNKNLFFEQHKGKLIADLIAITSNINQNIIVPYEQEYYKPITKTKKIKQKIKNAVLRKKEML